MCISIQNTDSFVTGFLGFKSQVGNDVCSLSELALSIKTGLIRIRLPKMYRDVTD